MNDAKIEHYHSILEEVTKHASETERRADEAERETVKLKKVEYMQGRIGEVFEGVISGMTNGECMWNSRIRSRGLYT